MATLTTLPSPPAKLDYVTALRGLAILAVVLFHTEFLVPGGTKNLPVAFSALIGAGGRGVQLFFVASAFTMFYSLGRRWGKERNPTLNFFLRRFFRIAPCYWLGILGYSAWYYYMDHRTFTLANTVAEVFFLHGVSPYWINTLQPGGWSITVEMCFYLMVPFLFRWITSLNRAVAFLLLTLVLNMVLQLALHDWVLIDTTTPEGRFAWDTFTFAFLPSQLPVFALGFILYFLTLPGRRAVAPALLLAGAALLVVVWAMEANATLGLDLHGLRERLIGPHIFTSVGFVLLALALSKRPYGLLVNRVTLFIGEMSFSLYLCHFLIIFLLNRYGKANFFGTFNTLDALANFAVRFGLVLAGGVVLAWVLRHAVEKPGERLGKRVIARLESRSPRTPNRKELRQAENSF